MKREQEGEVMHMENAWVDACPNCESTVGINMCEYLSQNTFR